MGATENLYAKYLLADRLGKIAAKAEVEVDLVQINDGSPYYPHVHFQVHLAGDHTPEGNEEAAVKLLDAMPELKLRRSDGLIYLEGTTHLGLSYRFYTGTGVCELVQVGTRTVPAEPERVIPAQPEREEPIFEKRCPDPLRDLAATS